MEPLRQRIKELAPSAFEDFCFHLLKARHPGASIKHVHGVAGDEGIDIFMGDLDSNPVVWQCKSFPDGVRDSQKQQIRDSLRVAVEKIRPSLWVLCISTDLDTKAYRWFQRLDKSFAGRAHLGLFQATDMVHELAHRESIRELFFPGAILNVREIRSVLSKTAELSTDELDNLNEQKKCCRLQRN